MRVLTRVHLTREIQALLGIVMLLMISSCNIPVSKEAEERFKARTEPFSLSVFPIRVVHGPDADYDGDLAQRLCSFLITEEIAKAVYVDSAIQFPVEWERGQPKMLKRSIDIFTKHVSQVNIDTDYALLAEILGNWDETKIGGVHFILADKDGLLTSVGLNNSHWEEYQAIMPTDRNGGLSVLKLMLKNTWSAE